MTQLGAGGATRSTGEPPPLPGRGRYLEMADPRDGGPGPGNRLPPVPPAPYKVTAEDWEYAIRLIKSDLGRSRARGSINDELQDGCVAVLEAARTFDPGRGVPFRAYVTKKIRWAILSERRRRTKFDRVGKTSREPTILPLKELVSVAGTAEPDSSLEDAEYVSSEVTHLLAMADERETVILRAVMGGGTMRDAARTLGIGKSRAAKIWQAFRDRARRDRVRREGGRVVPACPSANAPRCCPMLLGCLREWRRVALRRVVA